MLTPYPQDIPAEALALIMDVLRKNPVDRNQAIHAGWHLLGFAAGKFLPDGPIPVGVMRAAPTDDEAISMLGKMFSIRVHGELMRYAEAANISWEDVLTFVLNYLLRIASGELCPPKPQVTP